MLRRFNIFKWVGYLFTPIQKNGAFFVFMFALGYLCTQIEVPLGVQNAHPYEQALPELFIDIYAVCLLLALLPRSLRRFVRALLYVLLYGAALVDVYCYVRFESTLTPTMLMLVGETDGKEVGEFVASYFSWDVLTSPVGWILLLIAAHILWTLLRKAFRAMTRHMILPTLNTMLASVLTTTCKALLGAGIIWALIAAYGECQQNKEAVWNLMTKNTIGEVEHQLTAEPRAELYLPIYRLVFAIYANQLGTTQVSTTPIITVKNDIEIDSCTYRVPDIVLIIGDSYNKHHSQLYGYNMPTTPRQKAMAEAGELVTFTDVVSPWNLTNDVFKNLLSLHAIGDSGDWCDYPLFPEVFRKAGYHVTFITNQFLPEADEAVSDFSGGFFLNLPELSKAQFDTRNIRLHEFDEGVLEEYDSLRNKNKEHNLTIFHLMGSHQVYKARYPQATRKHLRATMYDRPELTNEQRLILADYDNSVLYNDSIVAAVTQKFINKDALVIYVADHGDDIFNTPPNDSTKIDYRLAHEQYEVPFWIWASPKYRELHPYGWKAISDARHRPMMTDRLAHLLLYLGGIYCKDYRAEHNVISPEYDAKRPRLLKGSTDYNQLKIPKSKQ